MSIEPVTKDVLCAFACYTLWVKSPSEQRESIQSIIRKIVGRNPAFRISIERGMQLREALEPLCIYFRDPLNAIRKQYRQTSLPQIHTTTLITTQIPVEKRILSLEQAISGEDLVYITMMEGPNSWAYASALIILWQYGDEHTRQDVEAYLKVYLQAYPTMKRTISQAADAIEKAHGARHQYFTQITTPPY
jgi:hypothetical protein